MKNPICINTNSYLRSLFMVLAICLLGFTGCSSVDRPAGKEFHTALIEKMDPHRWKFDWLTPKKSGKYTLLAHAIDANGGVQPDKHDQNYGTYVINHPLPIEVFVAARNGN